MAANSLIKFRKRLVLVDYFRNLFGVTDIHSNDSVKDYYKALNKETKGWDEKGRSFVYNFLIGRAREVDQNDLLQYDSNIKKHTDELNKFRSNKIVLKNFQILPALMTEYYLDHINKDIEQFKSALNAFAKEQNDNYKSRIKYPEFNTDDLNKLAFWMATGSGKTLIMHLNYYQYLHYFPNTAENILLVTPNEGLSSQHMEEMEKSNIPYQKFNALTDTTTSNDPNTVKVIEITKLVENKTGAGKSVDIASFEDRNLVFVDEGHKGSGSTAQKWRKRRQAIAEKGFTFEYSATFGQAVGASSTAAIEEEYGRSIIFDYSYPRFYDDGYGKDYRILNLKTDFASELRDKYLLANLLSFYEQKYLYQENWESYYNEYNIAPPLLVFIGHTVTAGKTRSSLGNNDKQSLSDVQEQVLFLNKLLRDEENWVISAIKDILDGKSGIIKENGRDLFQDSFEYLEELEPQDIYNGILESIFHTDSASTLHLVNIQSAEGEIGLRVGNTDQFFGVINIGDDSNFLDIIDENTEDIEIESSKIKSSLFKAVNKQDSSINILIGAKKFIEGWDSWRVSTMGLMNIGRGEGSQIIQLFGRGVRLKGKDFSLKRSSRIEGNHPAKLPHLETLNIFGIRASYMEKFRDYLKEEGIDVEERETIVIDTQVNDHFQNKGLLVIRPKQDISFKDTQKIELELSDQFKPKIDLMPYSDSQVSEDIAHDTPATERTFQKQFIDQEYLNLLNWNQIYQTIWEYIQENNYDNLVIIQKQIREILEQQLYNLKCPEDFIEPKRFKELKLHNRSAKRATLVTISLMILRSYIDNYYKNQERLFEKDQLEYINLDKEYEQSQDNIINKYEASIKVSASQFIDELKKKLKSSDIYKNEEELPDRVYFDKHLYLPLLIQDNSETVKYSPQGLNTGEKQFVEQLRDFLNTDSGQGLLDQWSVFLLRNQSKGKGIGFLVGERKNDKYFPDFILWLKSEDTQHITFIDPHGLLTGGDLKTNPKVQFHKGIKEYEQELNQQAERDDIILHSYIISAKIDFDQLKQQTGEALSTKTNFHDEGIFFDGEVDELLDDILVDS